MYSDTDGKEVDGRRKVFLGKEKLTCIAKPVLGSGEKPNINVIAEKANAIGN